MNHQHLIDSAIFDTTIAVDAAAIERQAEIEAFVKKDLMQVVGEVFDEIDENSGDSEKVFRISKLDLDLGEIPYHEFRQQMPGKLREQLISALGDLRYPPGSDSRTKPDLVDKRSAEQEQLFYFLRHGYLPWYSRLEAADALESSLIESIDATPAKLIDFLRDNVHRAAVIERLKQQFSEPVVERVMRLLPSPTTVADGHAVQTDDMNTQFIAALLSGDATLIRASWQELYEGHTELLKKNLHYYGQQAIVRRHIVATLSAAQFDDLLRLLEPAAYRQLKAVLDLDEISEHQGEQGNAGRLRGKAGLRENMLGYLLVERERRFDEASFVGSLLRQTIAQRHQSLAVDSRQSVETSDSSELTGAGSIMRDSSGLLTRLFLELQNGNQVWERAIAGLPAAVLRVLIDVFLSKNSRSDESSPFAAMSGLAAAIQSNAKKTKNLQVYYAHILDRLSKGERIDFDLIGFAEPEASAAGIDTEIAQFSAGIESGETAVDDSADQDIPGSSRFAPRELLLAAELLNTASRATGLALTTAQLERLKWQVIDSYLSETGSLFNPSHFSRRHVETLVRQAGVDDTRLLRDALRRALSQNSLPSTLDMTRRLADLVGDESEIDPVPEASPARATAEPGDDAAPLESIYIDNAGAVLVAPYLPRLFERLGLTEDGQFKDREAAERGTHCVQYLVNQSTSSPEYQLVLNKLLCGVRPGRPICRSIELTADEKDQLESLLAAIIENWTALGNTSITGLRESFLQRNGRLQLENDAWRLSVEGRPFDMLLDQLPWSFSTIKFAWMDRVIYVEWR